MDGFNEEFFVKKAAAKINLALEITGKRKDKYHLIESLIGFTSIYDEIRLRQSKSVSLCVSGPEKSNIKNNESNIIIKTVNWIKEKFGFHQGIEIKLQKNIPVSAGLGGGSADAAAVIAGCLYLWNSDKTRKINNKLLHQYWPSFSLNLGADIPIHLFGRAGIVKGIGEKITPVSYLPKSWLILANPRIHLNTEKVYRAFKHTSYPLNTSWEYENTFSGFIEFLNTCENRLTKTAIEIEPVIEEVIMELETVKGNSIARMSGSGPTCFALFKNKSDAENGVYQLKRKRPEWWFALSPLKLESG